MRYPHSVHAGPCKWRNWLQNQNSVCFLQLCFQTFQSITHVLVLIFIFRIILKAKKIWCSYHAFCEFYLKVNTTTFNLELSTVIFTVDLGYKEIKGPGLKLGYDQGFVTDKVN